MSAVVILNQMTGNEVSTYLQSVQASVDMDNGSFVVLGGVVANNPNVRIASTPTDVSSEEVLLVASPEVVEVNGLRVELTDVTLFTNPKDRPARAYRLGLGDTFTISDDGIDGSTVVGQYVIPQNGSFKGVASATIGSTRVSLKVLEKVKISTGRERINATKLQVVKV